MRVADFVSAAFDGAIDSPWVRLKGGLVLGSDAFVGRIREWVSKKGGAEEVRWTSRMENPQARMTAAQALAGRQAERCWAVWVRIVLGGERRIDVARAYGYRDGSAITQILRRLEQSVSEDKALAARMRGLRRKWKRDENGLSPRDGG